VEFLFQKADGMLPGGHGGPKAFAKEGSAALLTNGLLENGALAIDKLWKQRGYDPNAVRCPAHPNPPYLAPPALVSPLPCVLGLPDHPHEAHAIAPVPPGCDRCDQC
jgi:hypothetical protein